MCGISGFIESPAASGNLLPDERLKAMMQTIIHRGPDDWGATLFGWRPERAMMDDGHTEWLPDSAMRLALGHRRLAILDLSPAGRGPMTLEDGDLWITFNGEIYNYIELRAELPMDIKWRTRTDTEVLLQAYRTWGTDALAKFDGIFAFALYDRPRRRLICARDPMGIKPFYYATEGGRFLFGSEAKAVLAGLGTAGHIDPARTADFLVMGKSDHDVGTFYREVHQLPGGCYLEVGADGVPSEPRRYWSPPHELIPGDADVPTLVRDAIKTAVTRQLRSDVPVGGCLSGGLDSGAIAMTVGEILGAEAKKFTAITLFNPEFVYDETAQAKRTAAAAGMNWISAEPKLNTLSEDIRRMLTAMGEPVSSLSMLGQFKVFEQAHAVGLKVMLDGQGGDEVWLGYPRVVQRIMIEHLRHGRLVGAAKEWFGLARNAGIPLHRSLLGNVFFSSPEVAGVRNRSRLKPYVNGDILSQVSGEHLRTYYSARDIKGQQIAELTQYTLPRLLRYEDRNSMAFSIEARVPHLSNGTIDLGLRLPPKWQVRGGWTKYALRCAMKGKLPDAILWDRFKLGFAVPQGRWVERSRNEISSWLKDLPAGSPVNAKALIAGMDRGLGGAPWFWKAISVGLWMRFMGVES